MKHLKLFKKNTELETFKNSDQFITPNVSYVVENKNMSYTPHVVVNNDIEFHCYCTPVSIDFGSPRTYTFRVPKESMFQDCVGIYDVTNTAYISIEEFYRGNQVDIWPCVVEGDLWYPIGSGSVLPNDKVIDEETYDCYEFC